MQITEIEADEHSKKIENKHNRRNWNLIDQKK